MARVTWTVGWSTVADSKHVCQPWDGLPLGSYFGVPPILPVHFTQLELKISYAPGPSTLNATAGNWTVQIGAAK